MIPIPAIDLKNNKCVRLTMGEYTSSVVYNDDPVKQAIFFEKNNCKKIHIIDLDAAIKNSSENKETILKIRDKVSIEIQLGGGIRSYNQFNFWLNSGIDNLIVSSMAVSKKEALIKIIEKFPNKILIGIDDKDNYVMTSGWKENSKSSFEDIINVYEKTKIKGYVYTDINRDGTLEGLNIKKIERFMNKTNHKIIIGGGVKNLEDIKKIINFNNKNIEGIIFGKAFYSGNIKLKEVQEATSNA